MDYLKKATEYAFDNKVAEMQSNIELAIQQKVKSALESKRVEVASSIMFDSLVSESKDLPGNQEVLDVDKDGKIESSDLKKKGIKLPKVKHKEVPIKKTAKDKEEELDEGSGPYQLSDPKHPKFKTNYEKFKKANPDKKLSDFVNATKQKDKVGGLDESWDDDDEDDDVKRADSELKKLRSKKIKEKNLEEKLSVSDGIETWISDFVHSDDPRFEGKSKKERIKMAQGAYYAAKRANEEVEEIDELSIPTMGSYMQKSIQQTMSGKKDRTSGMQTAYKKMTTKNPLQTEKPANNLANESEYDLKKQLMIARANTIHARRAKKARDDEKMGFAPDPLYSKKYKKKTNESSNIGWMLKADPELNKKIELAKKKRAERKQLPVPSDSYMKSKDDKK